MIYLQRNCSRSWAGASALGCLTALALVTSSERAHALFDYWNQSLTPQYVAPRDAAPPIRRPVHKFKRLRLEVESERHARKNPPPAQPKGPLLIAISLDRQQVTIYDNGTVIAQSPVSTGQPGHPTPLGIFSVIQKERFHRSNLYSAAPMPFMQRITWSGVALHAGVLPGYPASHGCIRLPSEFAVRLWGTTKIGARVVIARAEVRPSEFAHPRLFVKKDRLIDVPVAIAPVAPENPLVTEAAPAKPVESAQGPSAENIKPAEAPVAEPVTPPEEAPARNDSLDVIKIKGGEEVSPRLDLKASLDGVKEDATIQGKPIRLVQAGKTPIIINAPEIAPGRPADTKSLEVYGPPRPLRAGPVSVFISKKEGKLFVRKGFEPIFDTPVKITGDAPLGTHVFTAMDFANDNSTLRWTVLTMPMPPAVKMVAVQTKRGKRVREENVGERPPAPTPGSVLDRISMPRDAVDRIQELMGPGASLTVSDQGLGPETGRETDFIVLTR